MSEMTQEESENEQAEDAFRDWLNDHAIEHFKEQGYRIVKLEGTVTGYRDADGVYHDCEPRSPFRIVDEL